MKCPRKSPPSWRRIATSSLPRQVSTNPRLRPRKHPDPDLVAAVPAVPACRVPSPRVLWLGVRLGTLRLRRAAQSQRNTSRSSHPTGPTRPTAWHIAPHPGHSLNPTLLAPSRGSSQTCRGSRARCSLGKTYSNTGAMRYPTRRSRLPRLPRHR
jgi:hypothetical protein